MAILVGGGGVGAVFNGYSGRGERIREWREAWWRM